MASLKIRKAQKIFEGMYLIDVKMKWSKTFLELLKRYCTGPSSVVRNVNIGNEISVFRTITREDILNFAKLTGDYNTIHVDSTSNIVHGALLNGLVSGVLGTKVPGPGTIVVEQNLTFPAPCYAGDTIEIKVQIISVRKIMKCEYTCVANGEKVVLQGNAKLIKKVVKHHCV